MSCLCLFYFSFAFERLTWKNMPVQCLEFNFLSWLIFICICRSLRCLTYYSLTCRESCDACANIN
uniref:Uncharacterized protein n=1 Tax=Rhizophora mucronata TaxID=61149 RepID=A0A2P2N166_RHIMU